MDKNTIWGLLLMAGVVFLFMYINKPTQEQREAALKAQQERIEAENAAAAAATTPEIQLVTDDERKALADIVRVYGTTDSLTTPVADLRLRQINDSVQQITGTVDVAGSMYSVEEIIDGSIEGATPEQVSKARAALKDLIVHFQKYQSFAPHFYGTEQKLTIGNDSTNMCLTFSTKGGIVEQVVLNRYKNERVDSAAKVTLFTPATGRYSFSLLTERQKLNTDALYFDLVSYTDTSVVMSLRMQDGVELQMCYDIDQENYLVSMRMLQRGMDAVIPHSTTTIEYNWHQKMVRNEVGNTFEDRNSAILYKCVGESPDDLSANKRDEATINGNTMWVAFKNQFFSSVIIPNTWFNGVSMQSTPLDKDPVYVKNMTMTGTTNYTNVDGQAFGATFYFGPNYYPLLSDIDDAVEHAEGESLQLNKLVPLGWGIFGWINKWIVIPVFTFLSSFISNYGIIILLLTIFIKLILFPFTYKSYVSQAKMKLLAPEIKEINDKYPDQKDAMKRQQETMSLYSRAGASPFSGCLPMLLQMPVLIAMFAFFPSAIELRGQSFLWVHDLSAPDYILALPFKIPFYGDHVSLFCLLMTATNIIYTRVTMQSQPANPQMPSMKWMMYLMPVMFLFFFNDYAAALSYYYFLSLLITIVQTYVIRHFIIDEDKMRRQMLQNAKKPKKKSGFMARLEEAQKKQEAYMRQQAKEQARKRR